MTTTTKAPSPQELAELVGDDDPRCDVVMRYGPWAISMKLTFGRPCNRIASFSAVIPCCRQAMFSCQKHHDEKWTSWRCAQCDYVIAAHELDWRRIK